MSQQEIDKEIQRRRAEALDPVTQQLLDDMTATASDAPVSE